MRRFATISISALMLAGCQSTGSPRVGPVVAFNAQEAAFINKVGSARIDGQAFLVLPGGASRMAAGETVRLIPATAYARARINHLYKGRKFVRAADIPNIPAPAQYVENTRSTTANSGGRFQFDGVAPGSYFVVTQKIYRPEGSLTPQGGAMYESVTIKGSETAKLVVVGR